MVRNRRAVRTAQSTYDRDTREFNAPGPCSWPPVLGTLDRKGVPLALDAALLRLVVAKSDGDTLKARCGETGAYEQITIGLSAIDAPEKKQPFGQVSRQHLAALCFQQTPTITPRTKDRYGMPGPGRRNGTGARWACAVLRALRQGI